MHDMLSTFGSSGPLTCLLPCSELFRRGMVLPSVVVLCCFPSVPLVRKLMQMMQLVMAAFPSVWQEILSKDVLASCLIYAVCLVYWYTGIPFQCSSYCYSTWCRFVRLLVMSNPQHERKLFQLQTN